MKREDFKVPHRLVFAAAVSTVFASCAGENAYVPPPPPEVDVQAPLVQPLTVYDEFPGRTEPFKRYEVRTRVTGFLEKKHFEDGSFVEKGKLLFSIESVQFEAAVTKAQGDLAQAQADLELAESDYEKKELASRSGAVSKIDVAEALAEQKVAAAGVTIFEAALTKAQQDLEYCEIKSAISGRVSRSLVDSGNLVSGTQATLLATVVQDDPIFVTIEVSQREVLKHLEKRPSEEVPVISGDAKTMELKLIQADGTPYDAVGRFHSLDNEVDSGTGTIEATAEFPNEKGTLAAGLSARLKIPEKLEAAVLIPATTLQRDLLGTYVFVLGEGNVAKRRTVVVSRFSEGELAIIEEGLGAEDRVIVSNLQRIRPDTPVNPSEIAPPVLKPLEAAPGSDPPAGGEPAPDAASASGHRPQAPIGQGSEVSPAGARA